jgi:hypothetical protein
MNVPRETNVFETPRFAGRVGLLAGGGRFPVYFAESARRLGIEVVCVAIRDHADGRLYSAVDRLYWRGLARLGAIIRCFKREGIDCVVMAGKVHKAIMFTRWRVWRLLPDLRTIRIWLSSQRGDNKDDSLLLTAIDEFAKDGIRFASALEICPELLVKAGPLTIRRPTNRQEVDIAFGWKLAKEMGRLDVGQTVAVKESAVLAVEAIEGTDQAILRAGRLCPSGGFTVVKVAKPHQDMRFDVPTIGEETIRIMHRAGAKVLAVEADRTILIDAHETIELANRLGISVVALKRGDVVDSDEAA